jgi:hypothetical protein
VADNEQEHDVLENLGLTIVAIIATLAVLRTGNTIFVRRLPGPVLRLLYERVPFLKSLIRGTAGDVPLLHEEGFTFAHAAESAGTVAFWAAYIIDPPFQKGVKVLMSLGEETVLDNLHAFDPFYTGGVDPKLLAALLDQTPTVVDDGAATVVTSGGGLIQIGMTDAWRIDP